MPGMDGIGATRHITTSPLTYGVAVLVLTTFAADDYVVAALRAGASGFVLKDTEPGDLVHAVTVVAAGDALLAPEVTRRMLDRFAHSERVIANGCDAVTVQHALGHPSASITLNVYSHLWPKAEDRTRTAAANLIATAAVSSDSVRTLASF